MIIKEVYEGRYFEIEIDDYITLGIVKESSGIYCTVKPKTADAIKFVKGPGEHYTKMEIDKGILKGIEVHTVDKYLDVSQIMIHKGNNTYTLKPLGIYVTCNEDGRIYVSLKNDIKKLDAF